MLFTSNELMGPQKNNVSMTRRQGKMLVEQNWEKKKKERKTATPGTYQTDLTSCLSARVYLVQEGEVRPFNAHFSSQAAIELLIKKKKKNPVSYLT